MRVSKSKSNICWGGGGGRELAERRLHAMRTTTADAARRGTLSESCRLKACFQYA